MSERRQHYRKHVSALGYVVKESRKCEFHMRDLSLDGFRAYFNGDPLLEPGSIVHIDLPSLGLEGMATITRLDPIGRGRYDAGFYFDASMLRATDALPTRKVSSDRK